MLIPTILILMLTGWAIFMFNRLISLRNQVREAFSRISVQLERRRDLMLKFVSAVRDEMKSERDLLEDMVKARASVVSAVTGGNVADIARREELLTGILRQLFAALENYPDLKSGETLKNLDREFINTADQISSAGRFYNDMAGRFNAWQKKVPNNIFAAILGFDPFDLFEISSDGRSA